MMGDLLNASGCGSSSYINVACPNLLNTFNQISVIQGQLTNYHIEFIPCIELEKTIPEYQKSIQMLEQTDATGCNCYNCADNNNCPTIADLMGAVECNQPGYYNNPYVCPVNVRTAISDIQKTENKIQTIQNQIKAGICSSSQSQCEQISVNPLKFNGDCCFSLGVVPLYDSSEAAKSCVGHSSSEVPNGYTVAEIPTQCSGSLPPARSSLEPLNAAETFTCFDPMLGKLGLYPADPSCNGLCPESITCNGSCPEMRLCSRCCLPGEYANCAPC